MAYYLYNSSSSPMEIAYRTSTTASWSAISAGGYKTITSVGSGTVWYFRVTVSSDSSYIEPRISRSGGTTFSTFICTSKSDTAAYYTLTWTGTTSANITLTASRKSKVVIATAKSGSGTVTGAGTYAAGDSVTLTATAGTGYYFYRWKLPSGSYKTGSTYTISSCSTSDAGTYTAYFLKNSYTITPRAGTGGSVSPNEDFSVYYGTTYSTSGNVLTFSSGETITATASTGYTFSGFNPSSGTVLSDTVITASFVINSYTVTTSVSPSGSGTLTQSGTGTYEHGDSCTLTASPASYYSFSYIDVNGVHKPSPYTFSVTSTTTATAYFTDNRRTLTISSNDTSKGTITNSTVYIDSGSAISLSTVYGVPTLSATSHGTTTSCGANAKTSLPYCTFKGWYYNGDTSLPVSNGDVIYANKTIQAVFQFGTLSSFSWTSDDATNIATGKPISNITAAKWNALGVLINECRLRCSLAKQTFTTVSTGDQVTAALFNTYANAIQTLLTNRSLSYTMKTVSVGNDIKASYFYTASTASTNVALKNGINLVVNSF